MGFFDFLRGKTQVKVEAPKIYDIVCPYCFKKFPPEDVVFRASHSTDEDEDYMLQEDEVLNRWREKFGLDEQDELECVINPVEIPEENKKRMDGGVLFEIIDKHGYTTSKRLCPACHNILPISSGRVPSNIISIVGASQVGKSVYMTSLIHVLQRVTANNFDAACMPLSVEVSRKYKENYEDPLFERGVLLSSTQKERRTEPLIFQFKFKDESKAPLMLVFFDVAGEGTTDPEYLEMKAQHIQNSAGILFLVDPLQMKTIRNKISIQKGDNPGDVASVYDEPREVLIALYENFIGRRENGKTNIPTAIVLTKSDMLKLLDDKEFIKENSNIFNNYVHEKYFNLTVFENINGDVKRFIEKVDRPFKDAVDVYFEDTAYFAVSALGSNPLEQKIEGVIEPTRVDEPFLWLLNKLNYIEGREE
ncbi:MAG: TRAFAC clade GTPase domain-containing protein [Ruminiclostridium sp.]